MTKIEFIARVRHVGWVCYQLGCGQPYNINPTDDQLKSLLNGVKFALDNPDMTEVDNHNNWMKCKMEQGWVYGEVKDMEKKTHPDLIPFEDLPDIEKRKDTMDYIATWEANKIFEDK